MENKIDWMQFAQEPEEKPSIAQSALGGALQGISSGIADEAVGVGKTIFDPEAIRRQGLYETYKKHRDISRARFAAEERANPKAFFAGEMGGALATAPLTGAATLPKAMLQGGLYAFGKAEGDPLNQIGETITGVATGGLGQKAFTSPYVKEGLKKGAAKVADIGQGLKEKAERYAFDALGGVKKHVDAAAQKGRINPIGRELLDEGLLSWLPSRTKLAEKISERREEVGQTIGGILDKLDNIVSELKAKAPSDKQKAIYGNHFVNRLKKEVLPGLKANPAIADDVAPYIENKLEAIGEKFKDKYMSFQEAEKLKRQFQDLIKYEKMSPTPKMEGLKNLASSMRGNVENYAEGFAKKYGDPDLLQKFKSAKQKYGNLAQAEDIVSDRVSRDIANRSVSPSDYLTGAGAAITAASQGADFLGASAAAAGVALANQLARRYGNQASAVTLDAVGNMLKTAPEKLGKYGPVFEKALRERGPQALNVLVNVGMKKDPELAQTIASELGVDVNATDKENAIDWEQFVKQ